jgi:hypothetical protein
MMEDTGASPVKFKTSWWPKLCGNATEDDALWVGLCLLNLIAVHLDFALALFASHFDCKFSQ